MCHKEESTWFQNGIENILFPFLVAVVTYFLVSKIDEFRRRRNYSSLGAVIVESLIEEVRNGLNIMTDAISDNPTKLPSPLPRKSWNGMTTIPDEVLLRIIKVSEGVPPRGFNPREIRIHSKNYFDHMCGNWDIITKAVKAEQNWREIVTQFNSYPESAKGVLDMLEQTRDLLNENSSKWFPK